ncbi:MAG TPA: hypothetical protein VM368_02685 [Flavisolibacter sp.]|nr:hypothetical protein [Flavisolibacter sp.]
MEDLFSMNLAVNNQNINYRVIFEDDRYTFISEADNKEFPTFSFKRENDEWHDQEMLPPEIKKQALEALEKYLLSQH